MGPKDCIKLLQLLNPIIEDAHNDKQELKRIYFKNNHKDVRISALQTLIYVLHSLMLEFYLILNHILNINWWRENLMGKILFSDLNRFINEFLVFVKVGFFHSIFSVTESSLRIVLQALDPNACKQGTAAFCSIYRCLFNSKLSDCPKNGIELLDLLREVRNTIHNNGVYINENGNDITVEWQDKRYEFKHGKTVNFVSWEFLIKISNELRKLLRIVMEDPELKKIARNIAFPIDHS